MTALSRPIPSTGGQVKEFTRGVYGMSYLSSILGQGVQIKIASTASAADVREIGRRLDVAIALINANEKRLSELQKKAIHAIREIHADPSRHTGVSMSRQLYNIRADYIKMASVGWLAATFVHDGMHILQKHRGAVYDEKTAASLEKEANQAMLSVARIFGLSKNEIDSIRSDHHTAYNVPFY
jgi:hypothetical protein